MATMREITGPAGHLAHMRDFVGNNLSARVTDGSAPYGYHGTVGELPAEYRARLASASESGMLLYIVRSYQTPIAWVIDGDSGPLAIVPAVTYSRTTTRHQSACRAWLAGTAAPNTEPARP